MSEISEHDGVSDRRIVGVDFTEKHVLLSLADGRQLTAPLSWIGSAAALDEDARAGWVLVRGGVGVNWPAAGHTSPEGALDVWLLEQDALFESALAALGEASWDASSLNDRDRDLVALWRLEADVYNGGFLQFLGNWGIEEVERALGALEETRAMSSKAILQGVWDIAGPIARRDDVNGIDDVYRALTDEQRATINDADEAYWTDPDGLARLVSLRYGPAPSAQL